MSLINYGQIKLARQVAKQAALKAVVRMNNPQTRRVLYIESVSSIIHVIAEAFDNAVEEYNLDSESKEALVDWVIMALYAEVLGRQNVRVLSFYKLDMGKVLKDCIPEKSMEYFQDVIQRRFKHLSDTDVKIIISGSDAIIAVRI